MVSSRVMSDREHTLYVAGMAVWFTFSGVALRMWAMAPDPFWKATGNALFAVFLFLSLLFLFRLRALDREQKLSYTIVGLDGVPCTVTHREIERMLPDSRPRLFERHPDLQGAYRAYLEQRSRALDRALGHLWLTLKRNPDTRSKLEGTHPPADWLIWNLPWRLPDQLVSQRCERNSSHFRFVGPDGGTTDYRPADLDSLSSAGREKLFSADPEMKAWWFGKRSDSPWSMFRFPGGHWVSRDLLHRTPVEIREELGTRTPTSWNGFLRAKHSSDLRRGHLDDST